MGDPIDIRCICIWKVLKFQEISIEKELIDFKSERREKFKLPDNLHYLFFRRIDIVTYILRIVSLPLYQRDNLLNLLPCVKHRLICISGKFSSMLFHHLSKRLFKEDIYLSGIVSCSAMCNLMSFKHRHRTISVTKQKKCCHHSRDTSSNHSDISIYIFTQDRKCRRNTRRIKPWRVIYR